ncbi:MinD/ParA family ATP-binding protein [Virgisporangium ochraceum]|nr:chromosome partitioning protein [Virgisporangium ochraceum]
MPGTTPGFDAPVSGPGAGTPPLPWSTTPPATEGPHEDDSPTPTSPWAHPIYRPSGTDGPNGSGGQQPSPADAPEATLTGNQTAEGGAPADVVPSSPAPVGPDQPQPDAQPVYFPDGQSISYPGLSQPVPPQAIPLPPAEQGLEHGPEQGFEHGPEQSPEHGPELGHQQAPPQLAPWQSAASSQAGTPAYSAQQAYQAQQAFPTQQAYPYQQPSAAFQTQPAAQPAAQSHAQPHAQPHAAGPQQEQRVDESGQYIPTAEEFARRREVRPSNPVATMGLRGALRRTTFGLMRPGPGKKEQEHRHLIETIRRNFGGLRQVTVVNPKGGAGKTVAVLLLSMTFGQSRGGYVLAWDNNETQGTLGMRAIQDFHSRTVRDLMRDLDHFQGAHGRVGDLSQYVRSQGEGMFDVLASDESATAGEMLTAMSFGDLREVVSRFYKLIFVDTGNNVRAENWQAAIDATDQLVVTMSARNDSAETAARMLDHLEQNGRNRLVRQAVTVVSMPPSRRDLDVPSITRHFAARTRTVMLAPYEKLIDSGEPIRYGQLSAATRLAWLRIGAAVAEGL